MSSRTRSPQVRRRRVPLTVRSQPICGNGGHDNYGRGEKVSEWKVKEIGVCAFRAVARGRGAAHKEALCR
jgi:hypothetical protein